MKRSKHPASSHSVAAASLATRPWPIAAVFALLLSATFIVYLPCLRGEFLWDDAGHVTAPALQSWAGLARIWFEPGATQQYYPLLHSAFWLEHQIWGDATLGYHLINVVWHAISATLFVAVLRRLAVPGALLAGLVFALHPVAVESVAWISEQKNTLSTVFYLAAALAWLRFAQPEGERESGKEIAGNNQKTAAGGPPSTRAASNAFAHAHLHPRAKRAYIVATLWFVAALLTKTVTATLPAALLVIVWWRHGRLSWRHDVRPLLPWCVLGVTAGVGTAWFEAHSIGAGGADFALDGFQRTLLAGRVVWFYLGKLIWPVDLAFFYPRWTVDAGVAWQWLFPLAAIGTLAAAAWWSRRNRAPLAALLLFGGTLVPVLGFVNVYPFVFSYVADHFQYLASLSMIAFLTAAGVRAIASVGLPRSAGPALGTLIVLVLGGLAWRQSVSYRDEITLYEATLRRSPASWVAHLNLGTALDDTGQTSEALPHLQRANELKPGSPETLNSLANVLNRLSRPQEALPLIREAIRIQRRFAAAFNTLGVVEMSLGHTSEGLAAFQRALDITPSLTLARANLGWALAQSGRTAEALVELEKARQQQPDSADIAFKTGLTLASAGRTADAVAQLARAVELQPENPQSRYVLGGALMGLGQRAEAIEQFEETLRLDPTHVGAQRALDVARRR